MRPERIVISMNLISYYLCLWVIIDATLHILALFCNSGTNLAAQLIYLINMLIRNSPFLPAMKKNITAGIALNTEYESDKNNRRTAK